MKLFYTLLFNLILLSGTAQFDLGLGLGFGTEISSLGIQARGETGIADGFDGSAQLTYFISSKESGGGLVSSKLSLFTIDLDGHYLAIDEEATKVYPLLGLNFSIVTAKVETDLTTIGGTSTTSAKSSSTEVGVNIGGGGSIELSEGLRGFGEVKYVLSAFDQAVISIGLVKSF